MRTRFAKQAARRKACVCCGWKRMILWPPPQCYRKKTKKRRSKLLPMGRSMLRPYKVIPFCSQVVCSYVKRSHIIDSVRILSLMKNTRRILAILLVLCAPLVLFCSAQTSSKAAANRRYLAYVGTYTTKTESKGIYAYEFDASTGKLTPKGVAAETRDPSWVVVHPSGRFLYAANEAGKASAVSAFAVDAKTGKLTLL